MSDIHIMPGHLVRRLQQISVSVFAEHMKASGLAMTPPQFAALAMIHDNPCIDQATLAGLIACDRPTIGGVVDRLVNKGFVERHINPKDRRAKILTLTAEGKALLARLKPVVDASQVAILANLTRDEKQEFIRLANKIAETNSDTSQVPRTSIRFADRAKPG